MTAKKMLVETVGTLLELVRVHISGACSVPQFFITAKETYWQHTEHIWSYVHSVLLEILCLVIEPGERGKNPRGNSD